MKEFDEVRIAPSARDLVKLLERAERNANSRLKERRLAHDRAFWEKFVRQNSKKPEGVRDFNGGRGAWPAAMVRVAWWTDHLGRQNWRITGRRRDWRDNARLHPSANLPLVRLYPDHVVVRERGEEMDILLTCPMCGMVGTAAELAWTGPRCGPCHDRLEEGDPAGAGVAFPTLPGQDTNPIRFLAFTSGGETLVSSDWKDQTFRWSLAGGEAKRVYRPSSSGMPPLAVAADGTIARYIFTTRNVRVFSPTGSSRSVQLPSGFFSGLACSPSGERLVALGQPTWLIDLTREELVPEDLGLAETFANGAFLDERRLCLLPMTDACILYDLDSRQRETIMRPRSGAESAQDEAWGESFDDFYDASEVQLAVSGDGDQVAVLTYGEQPLHLCHLPSRKWSAHPLPHPLESDPPPLLFAPDGHLVVVEDEYLSVWNVARREPRVAFRVAWGWQTRVTAAAISPDGEMLALGRSDGRIDLRPWRRWLEAK
jgi:hypothetical protein